MDENLIDYCKRVKQKYRILKPRQKEFIIKKVKEKYIRKDAKFGFSIYEMLDFDRMLGTNIPDSWRWIRDFIQDKKIIVFFNPVVFFTPDSAGKYIKLYHGEIFVDFYDESPLVEFYITDCEVSFLLGYNHSQCLFAFDTAAEWLKNDDRYKKYQKKRERERKKENRKN